MLNHQSISRLVVVMPVVLLVAALVFATHAQTVDAIKADTVHMVPMATSGSNLYMAWSNNDTGHWNVFFAKSVDGGKMLKTTMISSPNKGHTMDFNTQISASGSNVYVTWWTNKTGVLMPIFIASDDNG
ncbi:MAG: hypothetical protein WAM42_24330 [Candidatus Nitrosopolaris sp.]|jgi:hypothetical protein